MEAEKNKPNHIGRNAGYVVTVNMLIIFFMGVYNLIAPKHLAVEQYAYIKYYDLYINYSGLFHLGFINGIYLKFGSYSYEELPKKEFRLYTHFLIIFQLLVSTILYFIVCNWCKQTNILEIIMFICLNIVLINVNCYFSLVNQFTRRFVADSRIFLIKVGVYILLIVLIALRTVTNYHEVLTWISVMNLLMLGFNIVYNQKIVFGKMDLKSTREVGGYFKNGIFVMTGELIALIVLAIDSIFVSSLFNHRLFAMYSFAVAVISLIYMIINTVSSLIYPYLVRIPREQYNFLYTKMSAIISSIALFSFAGFIVIRYLIPILLPEYVSSIDIIFILFPTALYKALMTLVSGNFYKALKCPKKLFFNNVFGLGVAIASNGVFYMLHKDITSIAIASVITFILWTFITDCHFHKLIHLSVKYIIVKNLLLLSGVLFFYLSLNKITPVGTFLYLAMISIISISMFWMQKREKLQ